MYSADRRSFGFIPSTVLPRLFASWPIFGRSRAKYLSKLPLWYGACRRDVFKYNKNSQKRVINVPINNLLIFRRQPKGCGFQQLTVENLKSDHCNTNCFLPLAKYTLTISKLMRISRNSRELIKKNKKKYIIEIIMSPMYDATSRQRLFCNFCESIFYKICEYSMVIAVQKILTSNLSSINVFTRWKTNALKIDYNFGQLILKKIRILGKIKY